MIKKKTGNDSELIRGGGGIFEIKLDGRLIFSKKEVGRFPEDSEVLKLLSS